MVANDNWASFRENKKFLGYQNALQKREKTFLAGPLPIRSPVVPLHGQVRIFYKKLCICSTMELIMEALDLIIGSYINLRKLRNCVFARSGIWLSELIGDHWGSQFLGWNGLQSTVVLPEVLLLLQGVHVHGLNERGKKNWFISTSGISSFGLIPKS